ncbi:hypothetical protein PSECIP111854_01409 [Pseudoalteromonas sp. CIP111854]|uniref:Flagellar Assembly Protein A N-terminal region domain-containing protein n=1 Tax=Pseudoalteromonas holothuriae TaxID=2963714 RepID=A0A9W4VTM8_9GAMM|nr:FapA family protein [Pseudoalteromonas sp. CIP111854]CAH9054611.1 hypothetical protein PSECIP111854_01409 [Pseudoalteromonas sp. CIP111854]
MFKLAHNGNILLEVAKLNPPNAAFIVEALEQSPYADCEVDNDSINAFFKSDHPEKNLVVARKVDAQLSVEISEDKMAATAHLVTAKGGAKISIEQAKKVIIKAGVSRGYKQSFLEQVLQKQFELPSGTNANGVIARGRPPKDGKTAKLIPHVTTLRERLKQPKLREDGSVDMRDFGKLASVAPGTLLMSKQPATEGAQGFTVTGDAIEAKDGDSFELNAGDGTEISASNPLELVATIAGCPSDIQNGMRVDDVFTIGDVDVRSGHVDFNGSVIVTHNVSPGMKIKAQGDITVMGSVESGELISGGHIDIKQAAIGHLDHQNNDEGLTCRLVAQGDIHLAHGQYSYIEGNNIFIARQSNHCHIKAKSLFQVGADDAPKGKLIGGEILDAQMVIAGEIGSDSGAKMTIRLAHRGVEITAETDECLKALTQTSEQLNTLQQAIEKADNVKDAQKKQQLMTKIGATQMHYCEEAEALENKLSALELNLNGLLENTKLVANQALHQGVEIHIFDRKYKTTRSYPPCSASLVDNKIEIAFKTN